MTTTPRLVHYTEPSTTTMFSPLQLRPRALLGHVSSALSRWLAEHAVPFQDMVETYRSAVVVTGLRIDYSTPQLCFADAPLLAVRGGVTIDPPGERIRIEVECTVGGRPLARAVVSARVLAVGEGESLAASPGVLHPELRRKFTAAETVPAARPDPLHPAPHDALVPPREWRTFISRSHAEVADQWSYIEMVELATQARERLFVENLHAPLTPRQVIGSPTRTLRAVFRRPMFTYDTCSIRTSAHPGDHRDAELCFHHRIGPPDAPQSHMVVVETL